MTDRNRGTQTPRAPTGQRHGQRKELINAQKAAPLPDNRRDGTSPPPAGSSGSSGAPSGPAGRPVVDVFGPTARPGEPVTAGAALGPGPSSLEPMLPPVRIEKMRAIYQMHPSPGLARLIEYDSRNQGA